MKKTIKLAAVAMACCTSATWAADASTRIDFANSLPTVEWTSEGYAETYAGAPNVAGGAVTHSGPASGTTDVVGYSRSVDYAPDFDAWALGEVGYGFLAAVAHVDDGYPLAAAGTASWQRAFSLAPGESFSFAGVVNPVYPSGRGGLTPVSTFTDAYRGDPTTTYVETSIFNDGVSLAGLWASFTSATPCPECIDYGHLFFAPTGTGIAGDADNPFNANLFINLTNRTSEAFTGELHASVSAGVFNEDISAPVPEPETWAMMLAGMGLIGSAAAKRRKQ